MHSGSYPPAGKGIGLDVTDDDGCWIRAKIVEPTAIKLIDNQVYRDFSVGIFDPEIDYSDPTVPNGTIVGGWIGEVSLVDLGSNKNAHFALAKRAGREIAPDLFGLSDSYSKAEKAAAAASWYAIFKRDMDPNVGGGVDRDALDDSDFVIVEGSGDDKKRAFPIVTPADVSDAVSSWGRYSGPTTFEQFKSKLISMAKSKGPKFVAELPDSWGVSSKSKKKSKSRKGTTVGATATAEKADKAGKAGKAPADGDSKPTIPEGSKSCPTCKGSGTIREGNMDCPKCDGKGYVPASGANSGSDSKSKKAPKAAEVDPAVLAEAERARQISSRAIAAATTAFDVSGAILKAAGVATAAAPGPAALTAGIGKDGDDDVDDAVDDLIDDLGDLASAQQGDEIEDPGKPTDDAVSDDVDAIAEDVAQLVQDQQTDQDADDKAATAATGKTAKPVKTPKKSPKAGKSKPKGGRATAKAKGPKNTIANEVLRAHDATCPAISSKAIEEVYPGTIRDQIDLSYFADALSEVGRRKRKSKSDVGQALEALTAATKLTGISVPTFQRIHDAANKQFMDSYPDVEIRPNMITPDQLRRDFLPGANSEVGSSTTVPTPDLKPSLDAGSFDRPGLTENETRPTLSGGVSVTGYTGKGASTKGSKGTKLKIRVGKNGGSRVFYTNAAKDGSAAAMTMLHDHIVANHPGICPMEAVMPGADIDSDGQMGSPAEMNAKGPDISPIPSPQDPSDVGTLRPVGGKSKKIGKKSASEKAKARKAKEAKKLEQLVKTATAPLRRKVRRQDRKIRAQQKAMSRPDPRFSARRTGGPGNFVAKATDPQERQRQQELVAIGQAMKTRVHDPNNLVAQRAQERLLETDISATDYAALMVGSD